MLQQTQVARVVEKYVEFMRRFPTVADLAAAQEDRVLAAWQGLGYYGRARRLHAAAKAIVERFGGRVPTDVESLRSLPGIGRYTAGAIASIAFGAREPIVDTNVVRVLMRLDARPGAAAEPSTVEWSWERAGALVAAASDPAAFNEGLMELGATICPASAPKCLTCPLAAHCRGEAAAQAGEIPTPVRGATRKRVYHHAVVLTRGDSVLLVRRPDKGLWASMWQVPTVESDTAIDEGGLRELLGIAHDLRVGSIVREREFVHQTSHREVVFVVHRGTTRVRAGEWVAAERLDGYALSNPMRTIVRAAIGVTPEPRPAARSSPSQASTPDGSPNAIRSGHRAATSTGKRSGRGGSRKAS